MNDAQLLEQLALTDPYPADSDLPVSAWSPEVAFAEVEERIATGLPAIERPRPTRVRPGWLIAGVAFIVVLVVGGVLFTTWAGRSDTQPVAPVTTAPSPPTTVAPSPSTTGPPPSTTSAALPPQVQSLLADFERAYNRSDVDALAALIAPDAPLTPAASTDSDGVALSLADRAATASLFEEVIRVGECGQFDSVIRCEVTVTDRFADTLDLEPWIQTWDIEIDADLITGITASGENPDRVSALAEFQQFVFERDPAAPPLLASDHQLNRTEAVNETVTTHLVEFGALRSGIPAETWATVSGFYEALSGGDIAATEALFAPGGEYFATEWADDLSDAIGPSGSQVMASAGLREYLTWWHRMLQMDLTPRSCSGNATTVTCTSESEGIVVLYLPGGRATGTIDFTLGPDGIEFVENRIRTGSTGLLGFDVRGFWRTWMPDNAPEVEALWPGGNGEPPYTAEMARAIIEHYPPYLAQQGGAVPAEYLDGTLLADL
jgi:ketosteroid isomerase-like protein